MIYDKIRALIKHRSFGYSIKVFCFIHPPAAFITEQPGKVDQALAVDVSAASGGTGALLGTVLSLH